MPTNEKLGNMFRKKNDVAERSRSLLKGSAAKRLKGDIVEAFPALTKDVLDELMPAKVQKSQTCHINFLPDICHASGTLVGRLCDEAEPVQVSWCGYESRASV